MKQFYLQLILFVFIPLYLPAQDLSEVQVKRERTFTGSGLYGYMNGGAELYLEYGASRLVTRDLLYQGEDFTLDIYELPSAADAFGIYSLQVFKCQRADTLGCFDCLSPYQLQVASGNKYITLIFQTDSEKNRKTADKLLQLFAPIDVQNKLEIPTLLSLQPPYSGILKYAKGPISASWLYPSFSSLLDGIAFSGIWYVVDKTTKENRALIYLKNPQDSAKLKERLQESDIIQKRDNFFYIHCHTQESPKTNNDFGF